jgi:hypothetical protein
VPAPVAAAAAAIVVVAAALVGLRMVGGGAGGDAVETPVPAVAESPGTAATSTTPLPPPITRLPAEEEASHRQAFIDTMTRRMSLTQAQATCVADKVQITIGWAGLNESLMDPGKPGQLEQFMVACVKG